VRRRLSELKAAYDDAVGVGAFSDEINWVHVGNLTHINELLQQALDFRGLKRVPGAKSDRSRQQPARRRY
jgi:hypothetical protein